MSYLNAATGAVVSELPGEAKAAFIRRTYGHLAMAIAAFALLVSAVALFVGGNTTFAAVLLLPVLLALLLTE